MEFRAPCRRTLTFAIAILLLSSLPCRASSDKNSQTDPDAQAIAQAIAQLEERASHANPREQCYLYVQLVQTMVDQAGHQMLAGDSEQATVTLKRTEHYAQLIHLALARDTKRLKDAEKLMEYTTQRMSEYLNRTSGDDHLAMQATLQQLDHVHDELLDQVFRH